MGTSISHPSPKDTNWKPVALCYTAETIPESRVVNEIWRASDRGQTPISESLKSASAYECYRAVQSSRSFQEALIKFDSAISNNKDNSMIAEFAKRVIPKSFQSKNPTHDWPRNFFSEVTAYFVSRDLSGFVGSDYRNKSVKELTQFKRRLEDRVREVVGPQNKPFESQKEWIKFIDNTVSKLKKGN